MTTPASVGVIPTPAVRVLDEPTTPSVSLIGVNHYFGSGELRKQTLFDVDLILARGEIAVLTGPSGCGKTTLLTLVGALRTVQEGEVTVLGDDVHHLTPSQMVTFRRKVGFIYQAHNLFGSLTAEQNVRMALDLTPLSTRAAGERARELLTELRLGERIHYAPKRLSGGQRQRVAIARALASRPGLILADEPTAALDAESGEIVLGLLKRYADEYGTTVIVVTHDQRVLDTADRIIKMKDGVITSDVRLKAAAEVCIALKNCRIEDRFLFADLPADILARVAKRVCLERYPENVSVVRQREVAEKFYIVRTGRLEVEIEEGGQSRSVRFLGPGDFFGEIALLKQGIRTATVTTREPTELLSLRKDSFEEVMQSSESFEQELTRVLFERQ
jgi:putative ABC transport system ATP-binding protein